MTVVAAAAALVLALLLLGCGQKTERQAAPASQSETAKTAQQAQTTPDASKVYPINWCVVSGEELGTMGAPVVYDYQGRTIKFCCKSCIKIFEKEPARYIAKLDSAAAGLLKQPATEEHGAGG
jgi:YHS domain-containing protein